MKLANLVKVARNVATTDEALELLSSMGIEVEATSIACEHDVMMGELAGAVQQAEIEGGVRGIYRITSNVKGVPIRAIVVVSNPPAEVIERAEADRHAVADPA
jgi:hypothetical protein